MSSGSCLASPGRTRKRILQRGMVLWRDSLASMWNALHYYWITTKGYRLRPWASPYIRWRLETFFGKEAADLDARKFFSLMWRERARMERFLSWVAERRRAQAHARH